MLQVVNTSKRHHFVLRIFVMFQWVTPKLVCLGQSSSSSWKNPGFDYAVPKHKWYQKVFFHMKDVTALNANILQSHINNQKDTMKELMSKMYREIFDEYGADKEISYL
ncbi:hypothetical protein Pcinc_006964 [Petrolisthes cinctipes]|uniref:Uncharacterized protein n=1 Tax=Petrolisthes cinctipes TaxID=88211 RepID=A0AAE1GG66_PETCI|nr:hypothetical protein Pcinc_006964 [Petrolisthes cinctipes]